MMKRIRFLAFWIALSGSAFAQGSMVFVGGGAEEFQAGSWSEKPYQFIAEQAGEKGVLILSIEAPPTVDALAGYFITLGASRSVSLGFENSTEAEISQAITSAGAVFFRGGDQWEYIQAIRNTRIQSDLQSLFTQGGVLAGTSAGAMILGRFISTGFINEQGENEGGVVGDESLMNPFVPYANYAEELVLHPLPLLIDTHFFERGRLARLIALKGRIQFETGEPIIGMGVDDKTAAVLRANGVVEIMGSGAVHVLVPSENAEWLVEEDRGLEVSNLTFRQLTAGFKLDLNRNELVAAPESVETIEPVALDWPEVHVRSDLLSNVAISDFDREDAPDDVWLIVHDGSFGIAQIQAVNRTVRTVNTSGLSDPNALEAELSSAHRLFWLVREPETMDLVRRFPTLGALVQGVFQNGGLIHSLPELLPSFGAKMLVNAVSDPFLAFDGALMFEPGLGILPHVIVGDSTFFERDFFENRTAGILWGMTRAKAHVALLTTEMRSVTFSGSLLDGSFASGSGFILRDRPVIVVDGTRGYQTTTSQMQVGEVDKRQSVAISRGVLHVVHSRRIDFSETVVSREDEPEADLPASPIVLRAFPNPFNPTTTVQIQTERSGLLTLEVFDSLGRRIHTRNVRMQAAGASTVKLDFGRFSSGFYVVRARSEGFMQTLKLTLVK